MLKATKVLVIIIAVSLLLTSSVACQAEYSLHVSVYSGQGAVTPSYGTYDEGTIVTISAMPDSGWEFDHWVGSIIGSANPVTVQMSSDKTIGACFVEDQSLNPTLTPTPMPTQSSSSTFCFPENVYLTSRNEIRTAIAYYMSQHAGNLPPSVGTIIINDETRNIFDFCPLLSSSGGLLLRVPEICADVSGSSNDNCDSGNCDCYASGQYVWAVDEYGNTYSACVGENCTSHNTDGYQSIASCETATPTTTNLITISYSSTTTSQIGTGAWPDVPDEGHEYLILDMNIQNQGYNSFSVNSFYFSVIINQVVYDAAFVTELDNELPYVDILNGGSVTGKLAFEVPEGTTSFLIQYDDWLETYSIQWIDLGQSAPIPIPKLTVTYSSTTASQISADYWTDYPDTGYIYLIVDMTIQNEGYDSFSVSPYYFSIVANSVQYDYSMDTYDLDNRLQSTDVLSGGSVTGSLAFEVPESITTFSMQYDGYGTYNIQFIPQ